MVAIWGKKKKGVAFPVGGEVSGIKTRKEKEGKSETFADARI